MKATEPLEEPGLKEWVWHWASEGVSWEMNSSQDGTTCLWPRWPVSSLRSYNPKEEKEASSMFVVFLISRLETDPTFQLFWITLLNLKFLTSEVVLTVFGVSHKVIFQGRLWLTFVDSPHILPTFHLKPVFPKSFISWSLSSHPIPRAPCTDFTAALTCRVRLPTFSSSWRVPESSSPLALKQVLGSGRRETQGVCQPAGGQATHLCDLCLVTGPQQGSVALASVTSLEDFLDCDLTMVTGRFWLLFVCS